MSRFDELVGGVEDPVERERLRRVHELLLAVEPPPAAAPPLRAAPAGERGWPVARCSRWLRRSQSSRSGAGIWSAAGTATRRCA